MILENQSDRFVAMNVNDVPCACWLGANSLLLVTRTSDPQEASPLLLKEGDEQTHIAHARELVLDEPRQAGLDQRIVLSLYSLPRAFADSVRIPAGKTDEDANPCLLDLSALRVDLKLLLRRELAPCSATTRQRVLEWLADSLSSCETNVLTSTAQELFTIREALRERHPKISINPEVHRGMHVDHLFRLDNRSFYLRGWASVRPGSLARFVAVSPEGATVDLTRTAFWHSRPDISKLYRIPPQRAADAKDGFLSYLELSAPSVLDKGWVIQAVEHDGTTFEVAAPEVSNDSQEARHFLTGDLYHEDLPEQHFRINHVLPAISRLQEQHHRHLKLRWVQQYGESPQAPSVSIIVPLYRRVDFLEHQLAQFSRDPVFRNVDLIYILDSPELADSLRECAAFLFELYRIPFRLAAVRSNAGFAGVNNLGVGLAQAPTVLLMNSDVFPESPGWLPRMLAFYNQTPKIGALGVKLLFEDNTLQHAGMFFRQSATTRLWENQHYFKGLDRNLPAANITRQVPAVSAACLMINKALYDSLGGLRGIYVQGDYEDSDLCLRLREQGREIWYLPEVALYHLEGQSYTREDRARNLALNRWLHSWHWHDAIEQLASVTPLR